MTNPFDRDDVSYRVLINDEAQYSLWPAHIDVPAGWMTVAHGTRQACDEYLEREWTDMRPKSLVAQMRDRRPDAR